MTQSKRKRKFPFGKGKSWHLNAWRGEPNDFLDYSIGYFDAGNVISKHIIDSGAASGEIALQVGIYPILYLYRQATELALKHFIYDRPNAAQLRGNHNLENLWKQARPEIETMLNQYGGPTEQKALKKLDKFIAQMHAADPSGEAFRFPEDLQHNKYLEEFKEINLQPIYESSKEAGETLLWFADAHTELCAEEYEAMQEFELE
jgi:hypothetical protein